VQQEAGKQAVLGPRERKKSMVITAFQNQVIGSRGIKKLKVIKVFQNQVLGPRENKEVKGNKSVSKPGPWS
jgi:hypothetical protein